MISIVHPSRGRPQKAFKTAMQWMSSCGLDDIEYILSIDSNDYLKKEYQRLFDGYRILVSDNRSAVDAINRAAEQTIGDIIIVVSDDFTCPRNWGKLIERAAKDRTDFVMKVNDGVQNWIVTLPIIHRKYYERFGYIYYPGYRHMFCDTELTHVADLLKKIIVRNDLLFRHEHYSVTKQPKDEVTKKADATWNHGKELYLSRVKKGFGLGLDVLDISKVAHTHIEWLKMVI
jgi:glycosyltransferase involved in cell wall biosynthesis